MSETVFEWDEAKDIANQRKHGLSFNDALGVFIDPLRLARQDRIENGEARWQTIGMIGLHRIILVAHSFWDDNDNEIIRIISARPATRRERRDYENQID